MEKNKLVCIGDSIPSNCGLSVRSNTFCDLTARRLGLQYCPYINAGMFSGQLIHIINNNEALRQDLREAKILVLSCGGNNITVPYMVAAADAVKMDMSWRVPFAVMGSLKSPLKALRLLRAFSGRKLKEDLQKNIDSFGADLPAVFACVKALNPEIILVVQSVYTLGDAAKKKVSQRANRSQAYYVDQINDWLRRHAAQYGYLVSDFSAAVRQYDGDRDIINADLNDIHLTDFGHTLAYQVLYRTIVGAYPELAREEGPDVFRQRREHLREERRAAREAAATKTEQHTNAVRFAIADVLNIDDSEVDMDRLFLEQGVTTTEILEIILLLEHILFRGEKFFNFGGFEIIPHMKPADLVAMLDGVYPASVLEHKELLPRYASEQEKQEAERNDSSGLRFLKSAIRAYLKDDTVRLAADMNFFTDLKFNYPDIDYAAKIAEQFYTVFPIDAVVTDHPETLTVGALADYIDAHL